MAAESKYQAKLKRQYEDDGWLVIRMITATTTIIKSGVPDLLALKPNGDGTHQVKFIEVKAKNGKASPLQDYAIRKLNELGYPAEISREC
jgi:Holliday junction resolvase